MKRIHFLLLLPLLVSGLFISIHLTRIHYPLVSGESTGFSFCQSGCDVVNGSRYSEFLGIPLSSHGAIFYGALLIPVFLGLLFRKAYGEVALSLVAFFSFIAVGVDVYLLYLSVARLQSFCSLCGLTYLINLNCLFISLWGLLRTPPQILSLLTHEIQHIFSFQDSLEKSLGSYYRRLASFLFLALFLLGYGSGTALSYLYDATQTRSTMGPDKAKQFVEQFETLPRLQVDPGQAPSSGPQKASLILVDFSDFNCPHCKHASHVLTRLVKEYKGQLRLVFKQFPNDSACNPNIPPDRSPTGSCLLAKAALCAHIQDRFWEYHDALFASQGKSHSQEELISLASQLGLAKENFSTCLSDPKTEALLRSEIGQGLGLGVQGTPVLFFNGKMVRGNLPPDVMRLLIEKELGRR